RRGLLVYRSALFSNNSRGVVMKHILVLAIGTLCLLASISALAQSDRGAIAGTVLDSSGAAVSGALVVVRGADTGKLYKTVSTGDGVYLVADVAIGRYDVSVDFPGIKSSVEKGVQVQINTVTALNITLQPGTATEQVTVEADAPQIQTESSDVG